MIIRSHLEIFIAVKNVNSKIKTGASALLFHCSLKNCRVFCSYIRNHVTISQCMKLDIYPVTVDEKTHFTNLN
jgi:hypothetical protein